MSKNLRSILFLVIVVTLFLSNSNISLSAPKKQEIDKSKNSSIEKKEDVFAVPQYKEPKTTTENQSFISRTFSFLFNVFYYVFIVILALVLAYFGVVFGGRLLMYKGMVAQSSGNIKVLETSYLGPNKSLHLIELGDLVLLVGATQSSLNLISEISDLKLISDIKEKANIKVINTSFDSILSNIAERFSRFSKRDEYKEDIADDIKGDIKNTIRSINKNLGKIENE